MGLQSAVDSWRAPRKVALWAPQLDPVKPMVEYSVAAKAMTIQTDFDLGADYQLAREMVLAIMSALVMYLARHSVE